MSDSSARAEISAPAAKPAVEQHTDLFDDIWSFFASPRLALGLMLAIAVACLGGALVVQAPAEVVGNPKLQASWIAQVRPKYGPLTDIFQTLQIFWVFQTLWFRGLLGLLAINVVVCTTNRLPGIWHAVFHPVVRPGEGLFERGQPRETVFVPGASVDQALPFVRSALARHHRVESRESAGTYLYAAQNRFARFGTIFTHAALVLVLVGVVASGPLGYFEEPAFAIPVGSSRDVGHGTGLTARVDDFVDEYYPETGAPKDYRTELVLSDAHGEVARQTVRVNEPLLYGDVRFHQSSFGPAAALTVADGSGSTLFHDAVPFTMLANDGQRPVGYFYLPGRDLSIYVIGPAGKGDPMIQAGQVAVEAYAGPATSPTYRALLTQRQPAQVGDLTVTFDRELQFTSLRIVRDPGVSIVWAACILLVLGLVLAFYIPQRQLWARVKWVEGGVEVTFVGAGKATAEHVKRLARRLQAAAPGAVARPVQPTARAAARSIRASAPAMEPTVAGDEESPRRGRRPAVTAVAGASDGV